MLFLTVESWTVGLLRLFSVIWGFSWGSYLIYQGKKSHVRLLVLWGIASIGVSSTVLGTAVDFLTILTTGHNIDGFLYIILVWPMVGINGWFIIIVLTELLAPKFKWYFLSFWLISAIFYHLILFLNTSSSVILRFPLTPGEEIINDKVVGPVGNAVLLGVCEIAFLGGFGLIYKGIQSQGIIRKKYIYMATAIFLTYLPAIIDACLNISQYLNVLVIVNIIQQVSPFFSYLGLRKEPEKRDKKIKEEVKVKDSFFRVTQRPDQITEEEVTYYREQKICLMCKGKVGGFNSYICTKCEALYHQNCARSLSDTENACWVCNQPIDETKPTKPFKIVEEKKAGSIFANEEKNSKMENNYSKKNGVK